jgi:2-polyprenyl-3-methyl-5-hydroxy-6-metoxy-1,4-benzoquinol methylase
MSTGAAAAKANDLATAGHTARGYGWTSSLAPHSCAYLAPQVVAVLSKLKVRRVLDLGAGNGHLAGMMAAAGCEVVGAEHDREGVRIAAENHPSISFHHYGVEDDPRRLLEIEAPFEAVVSTEVVEHLFSPRLLVSYARAVLRESGYLIVSTPYHGYLKNLALSMVDKWDDHHTALWEGGHIKFWSRATLTRLLQDGGFEVIEFQGIGRLPWLWKSMLVVARRIA